MQRNGEEGALSDCNDMPEMPEEIRAALEPSWMVQVRNHMKATVAERDQALARAEAAEAKLQGLVGCLPVCQYWGDNKDASSKCSALATLECPDRDGCAAYRRCDAHKDIPQEYFDKEDQFELPWAKYVRRHAK